MNLAIRTLATPRQVVAHSMHRAPIPEDEPIPGEEPTPEEDPVPHPDPVVREPDELPSAPMKMQSGATSTRTS